MVQVSSLMVGGQAHPVRWGVNAAKKRPTKAPDPPMGEPGACMCRYTPVCRRDIRQRARAKIAVSYWSPPRSPGLREPRCMPYCRGALPPLLP